jgi:hypothetical protein
MMPEKGRVAGFWSKFLPTGRFRQEKSDSLLGHFEKLAGQSTD